jgi:hypothetical protein
MRFALCPMPSTSILHPALGTLKILSVELRRRQEVLLKDLIDQKKAGLFVIFKGLQ